MRSPKSGKFKFRQGLGYIDHSSHTSIACKRHVHGFLEEIGQGIQHVASRVDNLVEFVDRCNWIRESTGEVSDQVETCVLELGVWV